MLLLLSGKKTSAPEKPIPPPEPIEPVLSGSLAIGGISLAVAKAAATINNVPLYLHIALMKHNQDLRTELTVPLPMVTLFSCGKSSPGKLKLMKEVMLIQPPGLTVKQGVERILDIQKQMMRLLDPGGKLPAILKRMSHLGCLVTGSDNLEQLLILMQTACANLGLELGTDVYLEINCAAHELMDYSKGKYEVLTGTSKSPDEMVDMYVDLVNKHPSIITLIDPLRKEDSQQWSNLCSALGSKCYIVSEEASKSVSKIVQDQNRIVPKCSGLIIKYTNHTKISDLLDITKLLDGRRHISILGSVDGESSDDSLVDLAVGLGARFIKLGGLSRGERVTKYNRLLAIEEELAKNGTLQWATSGFSENELVELFKPTVHIFLKVYLHIEF
uniref:phosphopyruvate hydratase n=1 Tax=Sphenodon punctatus TaxID=8508 RepID=A0A8D0G6P3_SPHPU